MDRRSGPRVLILANDATRAAALGAALEPLGWPACTADDPAVGAAWLANSSIEAAIVAGVDPAENARLARGIQAVAGPRLTPILGLGDVSKHDVAGARLDLVLSVETPPRQIAKRLEALVRLAVSLEEARSRAAIGVPRGGTFKPLEALQSPLQVLAVGEPGSRFLPLRHALDRIDVQTVAAFSAYTAFDYLHERAFDAVILWVGETHAEASSIVGGMRRNARLHNTPTLLYVRPGAAVDIEQAYVRGFSDVLVAEVAPEDAAARTKHLALEARREATIRHTLDLHGSGLLDPVTGLFPPRLFAAHLSEVARRALRCRRRLSVAVLRDVQPRRGPTDIDGWLAKASPQIDSMVARLVRASDSASRLSPDMLAIALPGASVRQATVAAERVAAVIACTAFPAGDGEAPFTARFQIGVARVDALTTPAMALDQAARIAAAEAAA